MFSWRECMSKQLHAFISLLFLYFIKLDLPSFIEFIWKKRYGLFYCKQDITYYSWVFTDGVSRKKFGSSLTPISWRWCLGPIPDNMSSWGVLIDPADRMISFLAFTMYVIFSRSNSMAFARRCWSKWIWKELF